MRDIVFSGVNDWWSIKQRPQHLAERLAGKHRVLFLNPVGYSVPTHLWRRARGTTARRWRPRLEQIGEQLWVFTPSPALPFSRYLRLANRMNQRLLLAQLRPVMKQLKVSQPLLWLSFPPAVDLVRRFNSHAVIFDCLDHYPGFFSGRARDVIVEMEAELLRRADLVLATAQPLLEKCRVLNANAHLIPNGVDAAHFERARRSPLQPEDVRDMAHPRFGYIGTVGPWTDVQSMMKLAGSTSTGNVIVIGPWEVPVPMDAPTNFHVLGTRPYEHLPEYLGAFDVALIPFRLGPLTQAVNPVKLFEYAAAGVPIVATLTDELMRYASWCTLADSPEAFVDAALRLSRAPAQDEQSRQAALKDIRMNDWQARLEEIERLLQEL